MAVTMPPMASPTIIPMGPAPVDLLGIRANDQNLIDMTIKSGGAALNLTGYAIKAQARQHAGAASFIDAIITIVSAANGQITLRWPGSAVSDMMGNNQHWEGVWDLQLKAGAADPITICGGRMTAEMDVTR